jgi:hypothetical protein
VACVHVATAIYFLAYAKYRDFKSPGEHLNLIFIDTDSMQHANRPSYVKNSRGTRSISESESSLSSSSEEDSHSSDSDDDSYNSSHSPQNSESEAETISGSLSRDDSRDPSFNDEVPSLTAINSDQYPKNSINSPYVNDEVQEIKELIKEATKRLKKSKYKGQKKSKIPIFQPVQQPVQGGLQLFPTREALESQFKEYIPPWGATIRYNNAEGIIVNNTCNIDYFIFSFWVMKALVPNFTEGIPELALTSKIRDIIRYIELFDWNTVREIWVVDFMSYTGRAVSRTIDLYKTERHNFLMPISEFQQYWTQQSCSEGCPLNNLILSENSYIILFNKIGGRVTIRNLGNRENCTACNFYILTIIKFNYNPNFIYIDSVGTIKINEIPSNITIDGKTYYHLCSTVFKNRHFLGIFRINNNLFVVNDIGRTLDYLDPLTTEKRISNIFKWPTTISLYYLS